MTNKSDMHNLKRLIDIGKDKGYITYEELNDDLPDEIISSEHIDDVMMMFEELDIMVIDEAAKNEIEKSRKLKKKKEKELEKEEFHADIVDSTARVSDPVKMYLKEMGCISLLTREGEVDIAKRIEEGEKNTLELLLKCYVGIEYIIDLGEKLKTGEVKLKNIINDPDYEENHAQIGEKREHLIKLIDEIKDLYEEYCKIKVELSKKTCTAVKKKKLTAKMTKVYDQVVEKIASFKLEKGQLDNMMDMLHRLVIN